MIGVGIWRKSLKTCGERAHRDTKGDPNIGAASDAVGPDAGLKIPMATIALWPMRSTNSPRTLAGAWRTSRSRAPSSR